jgi:microcystin-dependent protein
MDPYLAQVIIFAGNFAPRSWMFCHGQLLSIANYTALFSLVGTTYGGDGQVTFGIPDLRGRVPVGQGTRSGGATYDLGQEAGTEQVTLLTSNLPMHNHPITVTASVGVSGAGATADDPDGALLTTTNAPFYATGAAVGHLAGTAPGTVAIGPAGSNASFSNRSPYLAINYIICVEGMYPSRN